MIVAIALILFGFFAVVTGIEEKTGCGCLGIIVALLLFVLIFLAAAL